MRRVAGIDAGSNTVLLLAVEQAKPGAPLKVLADEQEFVRLGEGVDVSGRLSDAAMERARATFARFSERAGELGVTEIRAAGTSALRDASNAPAFLEEIRETTGIRVTPISGSDEARLTFSAVMRGIELEAALLVVDVGGNSTELIRGDGQQILDARSLDVGAVRMTERFLADDPPTDAQIHALAGHLDAQLATLSDDPAPARAVAVAGTATTCAAIHLGLKAWSSERVHGSRLTRPDLDDLMTRFRATDTAGRQTIACLHPRRADVIIAGVAILQATCRRFDLPELTVADRGIRHALVFDALDIPWSERARLTSA